MSSSEYESESESDSSSSSSSLIERPLYLKKKASNSNVNKKPSKKAIIIDKLQHVHQIADEKISYDGVDDTDDIDPENEYLQWCERHQARKNRDRDALQRLEQEKTDKYRQTVESSSLSPNGGSQTTTTANASCTNPAVSDSSQVVLDMFKKRRYIKVQDSEDHSRPTRFKK